MVWEEEHVNAWSYIGLVVMGINAVAMVSLVAWMIFW